MLKGGRAGPTWLDRLGLPNLRVDVDGNVSGSLASGDVRRYAQNSSTVEIPDLTPRA
jgi:hypothetical protein